MDFHDYAVLKELGKSYWWFVGKNKLVHDAIDTVAHILPKNSLILDVGCGDGPEQVVQLSRFGKVIAIDNSEQLLEITGPKNCHLVQASAGALPFKKETFDLIIMLDILEHVEDDLGMLLQAFSKLKHGGYIFINVPAVPSMYSGHDRLLKHFRRYSKRSLKALFEKTNFKVLRMTYWNFFLFFPIYLIRLIKKSTRVEQMDIVKFPPFINKLLLNLLYFENFLIHRNFNFPIGVSLIGWCKK